MGECPPLKLGFAETPQAPLSPPTDQRSEGAAKNEIRSVPERMKSASPMKSLCDEIRLTAG